MSRDTNFYYSFLVLPAEKRHAIVAVWDFCRAVDDAVDRPGTSANGRQVADSGYELDRWRAELDRCYTMAEPETTQGRRLKPYIGRFGLPRNHFDDLIDGVGMDITTYRYETFDDLHQYCLRVASAVGLICIKIFDYCNAGTRDYAVALGVALQLTNIIRDIPSDFARDRLYLPAEDLRRFGVTEASFKAGLSAPIRSLLEFECQRARSFYAKARVSKPAEDARRLVAAEIMGAIYFAMLERIEQLDYDVFTELVRVPRPRRALIAATVWARVMLRGAAWV